MYYPKSKIVFVVHDQTWTNELLGDNVKLRSIITKNLNPKIKLAFETSQHEIDFMSQRTKEGIETARIKGKQIGAKEGATFVIKNKKPIQEIIRKNSKSFAGKNTDAQVIAIINSTKYQDANGLEKCYHISNNTYYKYKREISGEL